MALQPGAADAANRLALVIGNDAYRDVEPLQTARADASAMAKALERLGFKVNLRLDVDDRALKAAVRQFKAQLSAGDEAVFFYAGHGVQFGAENYLVPVNVGLDDEAQIKDESVPLRRVLEDMEDVKARFSLAIIDACRNNPFRNRLRAGAARGLIPMPAATGQMVIYSAGAGQAAIDRLGKNDRDPNGVFTRVFLREIATPGVPVDRVVRTVRDQVVALARSVGHEQVPAIYDQTIGDFFFVPLSAVGSAPPGAAATTTSATTSATTTTRPATATQQATPAPAATAAANTTAAAAVPGVGAPAAVAAATPPALPSATPATAPAPSPTPAAAPPAARLPAPSPAAPAAQVAAAVVPGVPAAAAAAPSAAQAVLSQLEAEQKFLRVKRALTILLEPLDAKEGAWIAAFEANLQRLRYRSAMALGPPSAGQLQFGVGANQPLDRIARQEALDFCGGLGPRSACRVVFENGKLDGAAFIEAVRAGTGNDLAAYRQAWRLNLGRLERDPNYPVR